MRKRWKRSFVTALSMALAVGNCVPAMAASTGWRESEAGWQYVNANGSIQKGWFQDTKGDWYFLDYNTGIMKTGWIKPADGNWYFMDYHTGAMKTGWIKPMDGKWYYLNPISNGTKGAMQTGWVQTPDKKWYYMDASGAMQTGTITVNNQVWTLDANGVWDGKAATSVTYVSTSNSRRPSGGGSSSGTTTSDWVLSADKSFQVNKKTKDVEILTGGTKENPVVITEEEVNKVVSNVAGQINNLTIKDTVGENTVKLSGLTVNGETTVIGGGYESIHFSNCKLVGKISTNKSGNSALRIAFEEETQVSGELEIGGTNVIIEIAKDIMINRIIAKSSVVLKGAGTVSTFVISTKIDVVLAGSITVNTVEVSNEGDASSSTIDVQKNTTIGKVEGDAVISGEGTVTQGYYNVTLVPEGGYWLIDKLDETTGELLKDQKTEVDETKTLKVEDGKAASTLIDHKDNSEISFKAPQKDGYTFAGWKTDNGEKVDLDNYTSGDATWYAMWEEGESATLTATEISATVVGTVSGAAVQVNVEDTKASLQIASGAAAQAGITSGAAVELKEVKVTATVNGEDVAVTVTAPTTVNVGEEFEVKFVDVDAKYEEVTIYVTIVIETTE